MGISTWGDFVGGDILCEKKEEILKIRVGF